MNNKQIIEYLLGRIGSLCGKLYADKEREVISKMQATVETDDQYYSRVNSINIEFSDADRYAVSQERVDRVIDVMQNETYPPVEEFNRRFLNGTLI